MSERTDGDYLQDIREAVHRIRTYTDSMTYKHFLADLKTQDAVIRNIEIIGEAAKSLSTKLRESYPDMPWKSMAGVRVRLIHHYFGVNLDIVWTIVTEELPALETQITALLQKERNNS